MKELIPTQRVINSRQLAELDRAAHQEILRISEEAKQKAGKERNLYIVRDRIFGLANESYPWRGADVGVLSPLTSYPSFIRGRPLFIRPITNQEQPEISEGSKQEVEKERNLQMLDGDMKKVGKERNLQMLDGDMKKVGKERNLHIIDGEMKEN